MVSESRTVESNVLARDVSFETYMEQYAEQHAEWVNGVVVKMSPVSRTHDLLSQFSNRLLNDYLDETGEGILMLAPFVMRSHPDLPGREPDLHVVLNERAEIVKDTITEGPADVVIEIISKESNARDRGEKFDEYEVGGVREYWLIDPLRDEAYFYQLGEDGVYRSIQLEDGVFYSAVLPRFRLDTRLLWRKNLPTGKEIRAMVEAMLA